MPADLGDEDFAHPGGYYCLPGHKPEPRHSQGRPVAMETRPLAQHPQHAQGHSTEGEKYVQCHMKRDLLTLHIM